VETINSDIVNSQNVKKCDYSIYSNKYKKYRKNPVLNMSNQTEENDLLNGVIADDAKSAREFFKRYGGLIRHAIRSIRICSDAIQEDDIFHDAIAHILEDDKKVIRNFKGNCSFSTYLYTVCRRFALNVAARENRISCNSEELLPEEMPAGFSEDSGGIDEDSRKSFREAYSKLNTKDQLIVKMIYFDERSTEEVMKFFNWDGSTVYSQKNKVRAKLVKLIKRKK
jgi:RNA polymerase sigma factor (sigma-70 family)